MTKATDARVQPGTTQSDPSISVEVREGGPYIVHGAPPLHVQTIVQNAAGNSWSYRQGQAFEVKEGTALCRCGHSKKKPYCDGSHLRAGVDLTETATFAPMLDGAQEIDGPRYALTDNEAYCAFARFCDNGQRIWNEVQIDGEDHARLAIYMAQHCPAGRLIVWDRTDGQPVESPLPVSLSLLEDPGQQVSGPLVLRGGVRVRGASGESYEVRNRQALCRCGQSSNKPFCDGSHASTGFRDGLEG